MKYYPINLDLSGKKVVVIGGGEAAVQKIKGLLEAQADIMVIARKARPEILNWAGEKKLRVTERNYQRGDLAGALLAFGTTLQSSLNAQIREEARERGVWFNAVDQPQECDFIAPARISRGELLITISTGGEAPFLSKLLRERLEQLFGPEYEMLIRIMGRLRLYLIERGRKEELAPFFEKKGDQLQKAIQKNDLQGIEQLLQESFGKLSLEDF